MIKESCTDTYPKKFGPSIFIAVTSRIVGEELVGHDKVLKSDCPDS